MKPFFISILFCCASALLFGQCIQIHFHQGTVVSHHMNDIRSIKSDNGQFTINFKNGLIREYSSVVFDRFSFGEFLEVEGNDFYLFDACIYPNPSTEKVVLKLNSLKAGMINWKIISTTGAVLDERFEVYIAEGKNEFNVEHLNSLGAGTFFWIIENNQGQYTIPFIRN